jgi:hypothetical protein
VAGERKVAVSPPTITERPPGSDALVDVSGRVLAGGLPVAEQEIEFAPLAASVGGPLQGAWDLTDEEGLYAVQLAAGRYGVLIDEVSIPGALLEVAGGAVEERSDLHLASIPPAD